MDEGKVIYEKKVIDLGNGLTLTSETGKEPMTEIDMLEMKETLRKWKHYPPEIYKLIRRAKPEIELLLLCMTTSMGEPDYELGETFLEAQRKAALFCFDKSTFSLLKRKYFEDDMCHLFSRIPKDLEEADQTHVRRDFIGKLCQVIISDHFPNLLPDLKTVPRNYSAKALLYHVYSRVKLQ